MSVESESELAQRVQRLEDVGRIRQLIDLNWFLADAGPADAFVALYTEDCVIDLGRLVSPEVDTIIEGHTAVAARYTDHAHSQWEGRSHHVSAGPEAILVDGDDAQALTYAVTTMLVDGGPKLILVGFNVWRLRRSAGRWRISHRWARRLGDRDVPALFAPITARLLAAFNQREAGSA